MASQGFLDRDLELSRALKSFVTYELYPVLLKSQKFVKLRENGQFNPDDVNSEISQDDSLNHIDSTGYNKAIDALSEFFNDSRINSIVREN